MKHSWKGFDYMELAEKWNVAIPDYLYDDIDFDESKYLASYISYVFFNRVGDNGESKGRISVMMVQDIRDFCMALSNDEWCCAPEMWEGMAKIESEWNLVSHFTTMIGHAWS